MSCCKTSSPKNFPITMLKAMTLITMMVMVRPIEGKRHFYIRNEVGKPVIFRCQSGEEDLGYRILEPGKIFDHGFTSLKFGHLLYFCHFYMEHKDIRFDVYSNSVGGGCDPGKRFPDLPHPQCYNGHTEWVVREDGFYKHCVYYLVKDTICDTNDDDMYIKPSDCKKEHDW
ncbi:hypothetical protein RND81_13G118200 [Saponaria officinalis]|uniref:S-protein homolog n=1 Tax=Saponaria officinalis TaxID=3572 RepID=A0AAW1GWP1_SAPOF